MECVLKNIEMIMWEKNSMPEQTWDKSQKAWVKTGAKIEKTTYTMRDEWGSKLVLVGKNDYREFERKKVDITLKIEYNEFQRKNRIGLVDMVLSEKQ